MKLSEAIRAGAAATAQAYGDYVDPHGATCALGAAYVGLTGCTPNLVTSVIEAYQANWPELERIKVDSCPVGCSVQNIIELGFMKLSLWGVITHLNDYHKWSREKIADWYHENYELTEDERAEKVLETIKAEIPSSPGVLPVRPEESLV